MRLTSEHTITKHYRYTLKTITLGLLALLVIQILIFGHHAGSGFVTDDYNWLESVVPDGKIEYLRAFTATTGFFRPLVGLSFAIQYRLHGLNPRMYGLFNLLLHLLNIILVFFLLHHLPQTRTLALPLATLFSLNAKANEMAVRWISSRTSLLCVFFMLLCLLLLLKSTAKTSKTSRFTYLFLASSCYLLALFAKETAVAMPIFVFLFTLLYSPHTQNFLNAPFKTRIGPSFRAILPFILPLLIYFGLRFQSDAVTPFNAPSYYRLALSPGLWLKNISEYFIRAGLLDILICILLLFLGWALKITRNRALFKESKTLITVGGLWFLFFLLPIIGLSARSDLYAYFPQIGLHLMFLAFLTHFFDWSSLWSSLAQSPNAATKPSIKRYTVITSLVLLLIVWTFVLRQRAEISSQSAKASTVFTTALLAQTANLKEGTQIWVLDTETHQKNCPSKTISYGFNSLLNLYYPQKKLTGEFMPPEKAWAWAQKNSASDLRLIWENQTLQKKE